MNTKALNICCAGGSPPTANSLKGKRFTGPTRATEFSQTVRQSSTPGRLSGVDGLELTSATKNSERLSSMKRDHTAHCPLDPARDDERRGPQYLTDEGKGGSYDWRK